MSAGFTPSPWRVRDHRDKGFGLWVDAPNAVVENNRGPSYSRQILEDDDYPEKLADANLIAAAPDLHNAATLALDYILHRVGNDAAETVTVADLRAALNKARGIASEVSSVGGPQ